MRPFIGMTCTADDEGRPSVKDPYVQAILSAEALPVPLPFITSEREAEALLDRLDGVVFTGSDDLDAALWEEPLHPQARLMHPARATTELLIACAALRRRTPALGICGGMQTLNVAGGGSLHQHIPDLGHDLEHKDPTFTKRHPVTARAGTRVASLLGETFPVNTEHHQAVHRLADGFQAAAHSPDGLIEAWEIPDAPFLMGVQWHPERMLTDAGQAGIFKALARAAGDGRR
ncbi:MAG: gamma-glutamyl-gamma-aminobutyrate hydrolase family protein [Planctomycetota bacterium]|jgi:gamma-glutamyl-gamma-aminobutyrate hydrolase PuuD